MQVENLPESLNMATKTHLKTHLRPASRTNRRSRFPESLPSASRELSALLCPAPSPKRPTASTPQSSPSNGDVSGDVELCVAASCSGPKGGCGVWGEQPGTRETNRWCGQTTLAAAPKMLSKSRSWIEGESVDPVMNDPK